MAVAVGMLEAQARFPELVERAQKGESVAIIRDGREVARLDPPAVRPTRKGGWLNGKLWLADDFDDTPSEIIGLFEGGTADR